MVKKVIVKPEIKKEVLLFETEVRNDILNLIKVLMQELKIWKEPKKYKELADFYKHLIFYTNKVMKHGFHEMPKAVKEELGTSEEKIKELDRDFMRILNPFQNLTKEFGAIYTPQIPKEEKFPLTKALISTRKRAIQTVISQLIENFQERDALFPIPALLKQLLELQREYAKLIK